MTAPAPRAQQGLLLVGHGSTHNQDGGAWLLRQGETLRQRNPGLEVACGFIKGQPTLAQALASLRNSHVHVVPVVATAGYVSDTLIPQQLGLRGRGPTFTLGERRVTLGHPVGQHPRLPTLLAQVIGDVLASANLNTAETSLLVIGHGNSASPAVAQRVAAVAAQISERVGLRDVQSVFLESPPYLAQWPQLLSGEAVIVLPFLMGTWHHVAVDLPVGLGLDAQLAPSSHPVGPFRVAQRRLWLLPSLGSLPGLVEVMGPR